MNKSTVIPNTFSPFPHPSADYLQSHAYNFVDFLRRITFTLASTFFYAKHVLVLYVLWTVDKERLKRSKSLLNILLNVVEILNLCNCRGCFATRKPTFWCDTKNVFSLFGKTAEGHLKPKHLATGKSIHYHQWWLRRKYQFQKWVKCRKFNVWGCLLLLTKHIKY